MDAERAGAAGQFDGLLAGLRGDADAHPGAVRQRGGEQGDQPGLAGARRRRDDNGGVTGPGGVQYLGGFRRGEQVPPRPALTALRRLAGAACRRRGRRTRPAWAGPGWGAGGAAAGIVRMGRASCSSC